MNNTLQKTKENRRPEAAIAYEPPRMCVVPVRCNGSVLAGSTISPSGLLIQGYSEYSDFRGFFQESKDYEGFSTETMDNASDWGTGFFD